MITSNVPIVSKIERASFKFWSKEQIKKISVKQVTNIKSFTNPGEPSIDGLYSPLLGPVTRFATCATCMKQDCAGHYGHIDLSVPVYHPLLIQLVHQILNKCCLDCFKFRLPLPALKLLLAQIDALNNGFDHLVNELEEIASEFCKDLSQTDSYAHIGLNKLLLKRLDEEKKKNVNFECRNRPQQRSIVERLSKLYRTFINNQLIKPTKICKNCGCKRTTIYLHNQSVIHFSRSNDKVASNIAVKSSGQKRQRLTVTKDCRNSMKKKNKYSLLNVEDKQYLTPVGAMQIFRKIWREESETMSKLFHFLNIDEANIVDESSSPVDIFFIERLLVQPNKFRPPMTQRGYSYEGPRTAQVGHVLKQSLIVQDLVASIEKESEDGKKGLDSKQESTLQRQWSKLQCMVNTLFDNEMDRYQDKTKQIPGLKQIIDKKEGLFRKNMMGKRVNFAARSVISPDPNIQVDEVGMPMVFAKKLTYPQPVTPFNIEQLRQAVLNGPDVYPGAVSVVYEDGMTVMLNKQKFREQLALKLTHRTRPRKPKYKAETPQVMIINRHVLSGDVLLFNRQPTLHKPSIMAFKARVLPNEKGFRLHYANCKSFNADFDGDEMNAHLPQSELARSEAYNIASVNYNYLVPKDGSPLGGLIQDHVVAVCILTNRDRFFDIESYNQLIFGSLHFLGRKIKFECPAVIKPKPLWTGKQVITTIIKNCIPSGKIPLSLNIKSKIEPKILHIPTDYEQLSDCHVIIRDGELITGFIDKSNVGATQYGLVHMCYELYGGQTSSDVMSAFSRLSTVFLQLYEGFTLGIADILVEDDANKDRREMIKQSLGVGPDSAKEALNVKGFVGETELEEKLQSAHSDRDPLPMKKLDAAMKSRTDKITSSISKRCLPDGLVVRFPSNNLQMMIQSGAKGGTVNALQISCLLGQIELEGRRVPLSMSGRSLPSFKPYDTSPKAGGFVSGRFLTGIQPQEFFFHCMAGREGLIDTAVKTSRSGYLQRCLIKHLEGLTVQYDQTVRDSCGSVIQFLYGEDGLDIVKSQMLKPKAFSALLNNRKIIEPSKEEVQILNNSKLESEDEMIALTNEIFDWIEKNGQDKFKRIRGSGFLDFLASKISQGFSLTDTNSDSKQLETVDQVDTTPYTGDAMITNDYDDDDDDKRTIEDKKRALEKEKMLRDRLKIKNKYSAILEEWYSLNYKQKRLMNKSWECCPPPVISLLGPATNFGSVPEKLDEILDKFCRDNPNLFSEDKSNVASKHEFFELCYNLYMKMLAQPGEAVGLLAAQSIGEPSTQMTLNTFHFAGRGEMNVTLGIPRLREILMTASAKIGTPSMDLPLKKVLFDEYGNELDTDARAEVAQSIKVSLNAVRLSDVLEFVEITEKIVMNDDKITGILTKKKGKRSEPIGQQSVEYEIKFNILPTKYYKHLFEVKRAEVLRYIEENFISRLSESIERRKKKLKTAETIFDIGSKRIVRKEKTVGDASVDTEELELDEFNEKAKESKKKKKNDDDSSSSGEDDEDNDDGRDEDDAKANRNNEDMEAEEGEDEEGEDIIQEEEDSFEIDEITGEKIKFSSKPSDEQEEQIENEPIESQSVDIIIDDEDKRIEKLEQEHVETLRRKEKAKSKDMVGDYQFDVEHSRWCKVTLYVALDTSRIDMGALIDEEARKAYIRKVGNIERAIVVEDNKLIKTEGVSLLSLVEYEHSLDLNKIYSNDIHAIANTYGIEAAAQAIRREMANVFAVYGIVVDSRHLSLIADYMTYSGSIRGMNRMSMEASASPFQQMSYESTGRYLKWAAIMGLYDDIKSPSAALVFGRPTKGGTGLFSTLSDDIKSVKM